MPKNRQRGVAKLDFLRTPKFFQNWVSHKKCPQGPHFQGKVQVLLVPLLDQAMDARKKALQYKFGDGVLLGIYPINYTSLNIGT